jgi:hypothetical protein
LPPARPRPITLGADKAYEAEDFVGELRSMNATPHVAQNTNGRSSAIDGRTTRHAGYALGQRIRKRIEEAFGWVKMIASQERSKLRAHERVGWALTFASAAYNLARLRKLPEAAERSAELRWRIVGADLWDRGSPRSLQPGGADDHRAGLAARSGVAPRSAQHGIGLGEAGVGDEAVLQFSINACPMERSPAFCPVWRIGRRGARFVEARLAMDIRFAVPPTARVGRSHEPSFGRNSLSTPRPRSACSRPKTDPC